MGCIVGPLNLCGISPVEKIWAQSPTASIATQHQKAEVWNLLRALCDLVNILNAKNVDPI